MMGIPGIDASALRSKKEQQASVGRSTMFGLPAQRAQQVTPPQGSASVSRAEPESDYDDGATQVVAGDLASAFDFGNDGPSLHIAQDQQDSPVRSTSPGGLPSIKAAHQNPQMPTADPWGLGEESSSAPEGNDATVVASANIFDNPAAPDPREQSGFSQFRGPVHSAPKKHETLMGMNLDELTGSARQTMFSVPSPMGDGLSEASEEENDAPTQAMSGAVASAFLQEQEDDKSREEDNRRRLLEKLRNNAKTPEEKKEVSGGDEGVRSTMFGIPSIELDAHSEPTAAQVGVGEVDAADEVDSRMTPNTGVLRVKKRKPNFATEGRPPSGNTGVLGGSSYQLNKDGISESNRIEAPDAPKERKIPGLRLDVPTPDLEPEAEIVEGVAPDAPAQDDGFERTRVASGELAQAQLAKMQSFSSRPAVDQSQEGDASTQIASAELAASLKTSSMLDEDPADAADDPIDATREQSLGDLRAKLRDSLANKQDSAQANKPATSSAAASTPREDVDATRQQDINELRAGLGAGLFGSTPPADASPGGARFSIPSSSPAPKPQTDYEPTLEKMPVVKSPEPAQPVIEDVQPLPEADIEPMPLDIVEPLPSDPSPAVEPDPFASSPPAADSALSAQLFGEEEPESPAFGQDPLARSGNFGGYQPEPAQTPMLDPTPAFQADPIQPEPHVGFGQEPQQNYQSQSGQHAAPPQQPGQQQSQQPQQPQQNQQPAAQEKGSPGRIFQVVFGVLALGAFVGSTAVGFSSAGGVPEDPMAMATVFGPAGLAVLTLIGCALPGSGGARAGVLVLTALLGIGIFALGLMAGAGEGVLGLVILLVAVLLAFAAAGFPAIAKAIS